MTIVRPRNMKSSVKIQDLRSSSYPTGFTIPTEEEGIILESFGFTQEEIDRSYYLKKARDIGWIDIVQTSDPNSLSGTNAKFIAPENVRKMMTAILIKRNECMGDILMTLPSVFALKEQNPQLKVDYCTLEQFVPIVEGLPYIDNVYTPDTIPPKHYDQVIDLNGGYEKVSNWHSLHAIDIFSKICAVIPRERHIFYPIDISVKDKVAQRLGSMGISLDRDYVIAVHARKWDFSNSRNMSIEQYKDLVKGLLDLDPNIKVLVFGDYHLENTDRVKSIGILPFKELVGTVAQCKLLIGPDSGLIHVAASQLVPFIGLFGPVNPSARVPYGGDYDTLTHPVYCQPCAKMNCDHPAGNVCITNVSVDEILDICKRRLSIGKRKVSVVMLVYNQFEMAKKCIEMTHDITDDIDYEFIIINNGSPVKEMKPYLDSVARRGIAKVVHLPENLGISGGWNVGTRLATGEYIVLLNDDTEPERGWLKNLVRSMESHPEAGLIGCKLIFPDRTIQHAGMILNKDKDNYEHVHFGVNENDPAVNEFKMYPCITGACIIFRRSDWATVYGFEERYFCYKEDSDFCLKLRYYLGKPMFYEPTSVLIHHTAQTCRTIPLGDKESFRDRVFNLKWGKKLESEEYRPA